MDVKLGIRASGDRRRNTQIESRLGIKARFSSSSSFRKVQQTRSGKIQGRQKAVKVYTGIQSFRALLGFVFRGLGVLALVTGLGSSPN